MKKLLLVVALGVAGLVSAKGNVKKEISKKDFQKKELKSDIVKKKKAVSDCTAIIASCGATGWVCGDNRTWIGFIDMLIALENIYCEN